MIDADKSVVQPEAVNDKPARRVIKIGEWLELLKAQGVPELHLAFRCPVCGTVQSAYDLIKAGAGKDFDAVQKYLGFSCVGRFTDAGPYKKKALVQHKGCDWTLGGLFYIHTLEIEDEAGGIHPRFEPVDSETAIKHMEQNG